MCYRLDKTGNPKEEMMNLFPDLFDGIGCVNTLYRIELTADCTACKTWRHVRVPESVLPKVKLELDWLVQEDIIKPVECPTV